MCAKKCQGTNLVIRGSEHSVPPPVLYFQKGERCWRLSQWPDLINHAVNEGTMKTQKQKHRIQSAPRLVKRQGLGASGALRENGERPFPHTLSTPSLPGL